MRLESKSKTTSKEIGDMGVMIVLKLSNEFFYQWFKAKKNNHSFEWTVSSEEILSRVISVAVFMGNRTDFWMWSEEFFAVFTKIGAISSASDTARWEEKIEKHIITEDKLKQVSVQKHGVQDYQVFSFVLSGLFTIVWRASNIVLSTDCVLFGIAYVLRLLCYYILI